MQLSFFYTLYAVLAILTLKLFLSLVCIFARIYRCSKCKLIDEYIYEFLPTPFSYVLSYFR